jgi:hypothetical protein
MIKRNCIAFSALFLCLSFFVSRSSRASSQDGVLTPEKLIDKHLKSLGNPEALAATRSRGISGKVGVEFVLGATGNIPNGQFMYVSEGPKIGLQMKFDDINYPGEHFAFDGKDVSAAHITPLQRSPLADFIFRHYPIMKEGLLGGVLSLSWPLLNIENKRIGTELTEREVEGRRLYVLEYGFPGKRPGFMIVRLFFNMRNFQHVRTEYEVQTADDLTAARRILTADDLSPWDAAERARGSIFIAGEPGQMAKKPTIMDSLADSKYLMVEKFDDFADVGGVILPRSYSIDYSVEGQGVSFIGKWKISAKYFTNNGGDIDQAFFQAQK